MPQLQAFQTLPGMVCPMSKQHSFLLNHQKMEKATKVCGGPVTSFTRELPDKNVSGQPEQRRPEHAQTHTHPLCPPKHLLLAFLGLPAVTVKVHLTYKILAQAFLRHYAKPLQYWQVENIAHIFPSMWLQYSSFKKMLKHLSHTDFSVSLHPSIHVVLVPFVQNYHSCFPLLPKHERMVINRNYLASKNPLDSTKQFSK